jgi:hypothetical protein
MRLMTFPAAAFLALCLPLPAPAEAGVEVDVEIIDRASGEVLPVYWHAGERHVAGEPGREYEIRLESRSDCRVLAVTSVDGVNVITGATASTRGSGYVLDPWRDVAIDGWRKSMDEVAAFYFTALPDSYAARTRRPENVGVIGVALFRERVDRVPMPHAESKASQAAESAADAQLGTGHGRRLDSGARYAHFERASERPDEVIRIYYDSRRNLVARGVIPRHHDRYARRQPDPFPNGFVPDP